MCAGPSTRSASSRRTPTKRLNGPPGVGPYSRWLAVNTDDRTTASSTCRVLPTAWQGVEYAGVPDGGSLLVLGLEPIGDMACRIAQQKWIDKIIAVGLVDERLERVLARGIQVIDLREHENDLSEVVRELTDGRGPDSVIDAVGMEAHGSPGTVFAQRVTAHLPDAVTEPLMKRPGSIGWPRSTRRSRPYAGAEPSRCRVSTAAWPI